jgi:hypothetical protein
VPIYVHAHGDLRETDSQLYKIRGQLEYGMLLALYNQFAHRTRGLTDKSLGSLTDEALYLCRDAVLPTPHRRWLIRI